MNGGPSSLTVLIAHTDPRFVRNVKYGLEHEGYKVMAALDGEQGLEMAEQTKPNLIILDLVLPRLDGAKVMEGIKHKYPNAPDMPLMVVIDNRTREEDIDSIVAENPNANFIKVDWSLGHIVAKARELLTSATSVPQRG